MSEGDLAIVYIYEINMENDFLISKIDIFASLQLISGKVIVTRVNFFF